MLHQWIKITTADCEVIELEKENYIFPIFKNGRSSLDIYANKNKLKRYFNDDIKNLKKIKIFLRDPVERFISGVYTYFYYNTKQIIDKEILKKIESFTLIDRHFVPQHIWLLHLLKFYKGEVEIKPVSELYDLIPNRDGPWYKGPPWIPLSDHNRLIISSINFTRYVDTDYKMIKKYMNKTVYLESIVKEFKNGLS